ncbi:2-hydroxymuconate tautomerase family protein [Sphingomonadaceae bacterium G21617-S1]|jgi:4-oxalocrotonate tautomerase|uniref:Tautomerase n=1 Tax=Rhizorhabdus wittichii TaxID=160791 RepID=A0A975HIN7_9SPHN|nr:MULTISPECIES: 2-hydroxymuconate tautomerase family protein [Sphingomonadaceae]MCB4862925.1 2-hydroxymuconate tautomerase family protein [Sphingobium sp. PNB]MCZ4344261.1 2-hydroxymuconate tautomerase family protein [Sphingomonadaceae bacterium G21617-S1]QTH24869.1 2-hydroxymuconate tautomerase family protein [Rhizorhabdus wittichii]QUM74386.1 2-hydroxymuconate tautomerase family protein [Sphingopyxis granuli]
MPIMEVTLVEGRTTEKKEAFILALTDAAEQSLGVPRESIRVILREIPDANFAVAGVTFAARKTNTLKAAS